MIQIRAQLLLSVQQPSADYGGPPEIASPAAYAEAKFTASENATNMTDHPSKNGTAQVVAFPDAEERARRLRVEVERLARLSTVEDVISARHRPEARPRGRHAQADDRGRHQGGREEAARRAGRAATYRGAR